MRFFLDTLSRFIAPHLSSKTRCANSPKQPKMYFKLFLVRSFKPLIYNLNKNTIRYGPYSMLHTLYVIQYVKFVSNYIMQNTLDPLKKNRKQIEAFLRKRLKLTFYN